jgi:hypothetical protein
LQPTKHHHAEIGTRGWGGRCKVLVFDELMMKPCPKGTKGCDQMSNKDQAQKQEKKNKPKLTQKEKKAKKALKKAAK